MVAVDPGYPVYNQGGTGMDTTDVLVANVKAIDAQADNVSLAASETVEQADKEYVLQYGDTIQSILQAMYGSQANLAALQAANAGYIVAWDNLPIGGVIKLV